MKAVMIFVPSKPLIPLSASSKDSSSVQGGLTAGAASASGPVKVRSETIVLVEGWGMRGGEGENGKVRFG